jgi:hypothetical protein
MVVNHLLRCMSALRMDVGLEGLCLVWTLGGALEPCRLGHGSNQTRPHIVQYNASSTSTNMKKRSHSTLNIVCNDNTITRSINP